ncbi:hypothetical protein Hypma_007549 [Hypsizygus marmoreus]|uniref:BRCT domain-containing protein n=1 Tax=Hypsizygus marmoreus TaxID=39966 RepID=A0A369K308_HYPMA|nr:hypothetical protein Hypma_007549 [Hypsizygus marmoreus]
MSTTIFSEKRTRSQVTLPDEILQQLSQRSPLKDARIALRNNTSTLSECSMDVHAEEVEETDDELLLSPGKVLPVPRAKRSASPSARDEYSSHSDTPVDGRELKRVKRDTEPSRNDESDITNTKNTNARHAFVPTPTHTRTLSQPETRKKSSRARSGTASGVINRDTSPVGTTGVSGKGRAQSVPLFPAASSSTVIHIDLRNPPPSPRRPRSRSPSKEREFRIVSGPMLVPKLDPIPDETNSGMHIDEDVFKSPDSQPLRPAINSLNDPPTIGIISSSEDAAQTVPVVQGLPTIIEVPSTPDTHRPTMSFMSPLTPLPETPHPSKLEGITNNRYAGAGWGTDPEEEDEDNDSSLAPPNPKPFPVSGATTQSRLPRPSSIVNLSSTSQGSAGNSARPESAVPMGPPPILPTKKPLPPVSSKLPPIVSEKVEKKDAFVALLNGARQMKEQEIAKGKGKERASSSKAASSSSSSVKYGAGNAGPSKTQKSKSNDGPKAMKEAESPRMSLKAKMRPKGKPKAKPVPAPIPMPSYDSEVEDKEQPRAPSPVPTLQPSRPSTPPPMDVSMEFIDAPSPAKSAQPAPASTAEVHPANSIAVMEHEPSERFQESEPSAATVHNDPHYPNTTPGTNVPAMDLTPTPGEPPAPKPTTKKPHMSKRMPTAAVERVTRSTSSRLGKLQLEVTRPLQRTTSGKEVVGQKKSIPSLLPVASGSSSKDTVMKPKPAPDFPYDTGASTSSLSSLPTDPITDPALPSGSPMKLSSPAKKTRESSFARPTHSAAAKQVRSPVKAKLAKSGAPSPNKLTRAASMFTARPTATGLSRTFTGFGPSAGGPSSLSTLSSALEKLRMPPPGRPNTSMGFNRDIDSDTSFELKQDSKDDTAIGQLALKPTSGPSKAGSQGGNGGRLVQRTLISGGSSSRTGKSIFGGGTIMRGSGGFKVPGNSLKTGSRIFGAGGGTFSGAARARSMQKASRKTSLPSVMASPVKGGGSDGTVADDDDDDMAVVAGTGAESSADSKKDVSADVPTTGPTTSEKGKEKERPAEAWRMNASMRVSLASQALSQSLSPLPSKETGLMGPPATPAGRSGMRSTSSSYPSTSSAGKAPERVSPNTRSMTMALRSAPGGLEKTRGGVGGHISSGKKTAAEAPESLKILKDCVIFVDVRTDDGDEAGSLFVEMLESVGARILTRVGQTCTHIVFKNGLMSSLTRYRLLRDPKPLVVGIGWVVECVEQRQQVDETKFLVDLDGMNVSGTNKRRRSMLPKLISRDLDESSSDIERDREGADGDVSMDGSTSSLIDDGLTPLEKARRRKGITT